MGSQVGQESTVVVHPAVWARLRAEPFCFSFFQTVRLLCRIFPERKGIGEFEPPGDEIARFGAFPTLAFPASEIQSLETGGPAPPRFAVNFMGLTGPLGVLPRYYTELVAERVRAKDRAPRDFLDIFNHRSISLFYRAWEKHRVAVQIERGLDHRFRFYLLSLIGLATMGLQKRQTVLDDSLIFFAGLLSMQPKSAEALRDVLMDYFDVPVEIEQFVGVWRRLRRPDQTRLEDWDDPSGSLGLGSVVGDEIYDQQFRVRISIGPVPLKRYLDFLPGGAAYEPLRAIARFFSSDLEYELQLILQREDVPGCELGNLGDDAPRLGWVTWMKTQPEFDRDAGENILLLTKGARNERKS